MILYRVAALLAVFFGLACRSVSAQGMHDVKGMPDNHHGALAEQVISALSTGEGEAFATLLSTNGTPTFAQSRNAVDDRTFARKFGFRSQGLAIWGRRVFGAEGDELNVLATENLTGRWRQITFIFAKDKIDSFGIAYAMPPEHDRPGPLTKAQAQKKIAAYLDAAESAGLFSGVVLIAQHEDILLQSAHGLASARYAVPNTLATRFNLASVNKMFTASLILRMVEAGNLSLETPVSDILDDSWIAPEIGAKITIRHLLTHMSGLGSYFTEDFMASSPLLYRNIEDYKAVVRAQIPAFEPGTGWLYSNAGYTLLGAVLEMLSGETYDAQLADTIFNPLGMNASGCFAKDAPIANVATNLYIDFSEDAPAWREETALGTVRGASAGGCYATAGDLSRFAYALLKNEIFSAEMRDAAWTDYTPEGSREDYGLGFFLWNGPFGQYVGHSGGFIGPNAELKIDPETGWVIIALSNSSEGLRETMGLIEGTLSRIKN